MICSHRPSSPPRFWTQFSDWGVHEVINNLSGTVAYLFALVLWTSSIGWMRRRFFEVSLRSISSAGGVAPTQPPLASGYASRLEAPLPVVRNKLHPWLVAQPGRCYGWMGCTCQNSAVPACHTPRPPAPAGVLPLPHRLLPRLHAVLVHPLLLELVLLPARQAGSQSHPLRVVAGVVAAPFTWPPAANTAAGMPSTGELGEPCRCHAPPAPMQHLPHTPHDQLVVCGTISTGAAVRACA